MAPTGKFNRVQHQSLANHDSCCIPRKMEERCNIKEAVYGFHVVFFAEKYKITHSPCILADFRYNIKACDFARNPCDGPLHRHLVHREVKERWQIMK